MKWVKIKLIERIDSHEEEWIVENETHTAKGLYIDGQLVDTTAEVEK